MGQGWGYRSAVTLSSNITACSPSRAAPGVGALSQSHFRSATLRRTANKAKVCGRPPSRKVKIQRSWSHSKEKGASVTMPHILLVEDDDKLRRALATWLIYAGYQVTQAPDGETALSLLEREAFAVVLTDIVMGNRDGIAV